MKRYFLTRTFLVYFLLAQFYLLLSNVPMLIKVVRTPPYTIYPLFHSNAPEDYQNYLAVITLGANGFWLNRDPYTSEPTKPGIFYVPYLLVGKFAGILHAWPPVVYHAARLLFVQLLIIATYLFIRTITTGKTRFMALIISVVATVSPPFLYGRSGAFTSFAPWWGQLDALWRMDALPHHVLGNALFFITLILFFSHRLTLKKTHLFLLASLTTLQGIIFPPSLFPYVFGLPITYLLYGIFLLSRRRPVSISRQQVIKSVVVLAACVLPILLNKYQTSLGFPWTQWINWEVTRWNFMETDFLKALILSFGILPILCIPAVIRIVRSPSFQNLFLVVWSILPLLLYPFANILNIGRVRLVQTAPFVPFAILSAYSICQAFEHRKRLQTLLFAFILLSSIPVSLFILWIGATDALHVLPYRNLYIRSAVWNMIDVLKMNSNTHSIVLSDQSLGNMIPAYVPVISYFGHANQTMYLDRKQDEVRVFYTQRYSSQWAQDFVRRNNISFVVFSQDEKDLGSFTLSYPFLKKIFQQEDVELYAVNL